MPRKLRNTGLLASLALAAAAVPAEAVPSFALQTGQNCQACHVGGFGPQLTAYGREFKIGGYTARAGKFTLPVSAQVIASYIRTQRDPPAPAAPGFHPNDNLALDQVGLFLAGGVGSHFGGFAQVTYDGVAKAWSWDNLDLRAVSHATIAGEDIVFGASLNNSPGTEDPWNTLPAWGYPYTGSALAPSPSAAPLFAGGLAQNVIGLTGYAWIDSKVYIEAGGYRTPSAGTLRWLGADPFSPGDIDGVAPYVRVAYQRPIGGGTAQIGAFLLRASLFPGRDRSTGTTDGYTDVGVDASWLIPRENGDVLSFNLRYTHEETALRASQLLGAAFNRNDRLDDIRVDASYYFRNVVGATVGVFSTTGTADPLRFASPTGKPDSDGVLFQLDGTPFGKGSPVGPWFNVRMGIQYTLYGRFNGTRRNYDGFGANAPDNNTLRIFTWLAF